MSTCNEHRFRGCVVRCYPEARYLETVFPDGSRCPAAPNDDPESVARARSLGYGDDLWRMTVEHELAHTLVTDSFGWGRSPTLWAVAHQYTDEYTPHEEAIVLAVQRYGNDWTWNDLLLQVDNVADMVASLHSLADQLMACEGVPA